MSFTTQADAAKKGIWTPQMEEVFCAEGIGKEDLIKGIAAGEIVIPANRNHKNLKARGIGRGLKTKINVNLGVSEDVCDRDMEMRKVELAKRLLGTGMPGGEIAGHIGFAGQNYFIRFFKRQTGMTPEAFRRTLWKSAVTPPH